MSLLGVVVPPAGTDSRIQGANRPRQARRPAAPQQVHDRFQQNESPSPATKTAHNEVPPRQQPNPAGARSRSRCNSSLSSCSEMADVGVVVPAHRGQLDPGTLGLQPRNRWIGTSPFQNRSQFHQYQDLEGVRDEAAAVAAAAAADGKGAWSSSGGPSSASDVSSTNSVQGQQGQGTDSASRNQRNLFRFSIRGRTQDKPGRVGSRTTRDGGTPTAGPPVVGLSYGYENVVPLSKVIAEAAAQTTSSSGVTSDDDESAGYCSSSTTTTDRQRSGGPLRSSPPSSGMMMPLVFFPKSKRMFQLSMPSKRFRRVDAASVDHHLEVAENNGGGGREVQQVPAEARGPPAKGRPRAAPASQSKARHDDLRRRQQPIILEEDEDNYVRNKQRLGQTTPSNLGQVFLGQQRRPIETSI